MNTLPLAKREFNTLKWVVLFVLIIETAVLLQFNNMVLGRFGGWSVMRILGTFDTGTPFFSSLPNTYFLYIAVIGLSLTQFYGINQLFLFSLPIRKKDLLKIKLVSGVFSYTLWVLAYGVGLTAIFIKNSHWLTALYQHFPEDIYLRVASQNNVVIIGQHVLLLWLSITATYAVCVFFQVVFKNKIVAGILSFAALYYPMFLCSSLVNALYHPTNIDWQWKETVRLNIDRLARGIQLLSLPHISEFEYEYIGHPLISKADGISEFGISLSLFILNHMAFKIIFAAVAAAGFLWLTFLCFQSGRSNDRKIFKLSVAVCIAALSLILICKLLPYMPYMKTYRQPVEEETHVYETVEIPVNVNKTIDVKKREAYVKLDDFLAEYMDYSQIEKHEETRQKTFKLFGLETLGYYDIYKGMDGLGFSFSADDFLSKTGIPAALEQQGFQGIEEFIARSEQNYQEIPVPESPWLIMHPYFYYDEDAKAVITYYITSHSYRNEPSNVSLYILFRTALSYPDQYEELVKGLESADNYFSGYFTGGHKDVMIFENPEFIVNIAHDRYTNGENQYPVANYPMKTWLYGNDGAIESVKMAVMLSKNFVIENTALDGMDAYLDIMGIARQDRDAMKETVINALYAEDSGSTKNQSPNSTYEMYVTNIQQDYRLVEIVIRK